LSLASEPKRVVSSEKLDQLEGMKFNAARSLQQKEWELEGLQRHVREVKEKSNQLDTTHSPDDAREKQAVYRILSP
jgi:hypothetical protein